MKKRRLGFLLSIVAVASFAFGCAANAGLKNLKPVNLSYSEEMTADFGQDEEVWPDKGLKERYGQYWALRFDRQNEQLYKMEAPYVKELIGYKRYLEYMEMTAFRSVSGIEILEIEEPSEFVRAVKMNVQIPLKDGGVKDVYYLDEWVEVGGEWYHMLKDYFQFRELE